MLRVERIGWGQFLHGSACGGRVREKRDAVNGYAFFTASVFMFSIAFRSAFS
jgi:hypothetical protein